MSCIIIETESCQFNGNNVIEQDYPDSGKIHCTHPDNEKEKIQCTHPDNEKEKIQCTQCCSDGGFAIQPLYTLYFGMKLKCDCV